MGATPSTDRSKLSTIKFERRPTLCQAFEAIKTYLNQLKQLLIRVKERARDAAGSRWRGISEAAKSLVRGLLRVNPVDRLSLEECLNHPWVTGQPLPPKRLEPVKWEAWQHQWLFSGFHSTDPNGLTLAPPVCPSSGFAWPAPWDGCYRRARDAKERTGALRASASCKIPGASGRAGGC